MRAVSLILCGVVAGALPACGSAGESPLPTARTNPLAGAEALNSPRARQAEVVAQQIWPPLRRAFGSRWRGISVSADAVIHVRTGFSRDADPNAPAITAACQTIEPAITPADPVQIEAQDATPLRRC